MSRFLPAACAALFLPALLAAAPARADTVHTCTGTISVLPATVSTAGTWCVASAQFTAINSGAAITIDANNVTLACDGMPLRGTAGTASLARGVVIAPGRSNVTVRDCVLSGFHTAILATDAAAYGLAAEDNIVDGVHYTGIQLAGAGTIARNRLTTIGGATTGLAPTAILASGDFDISGNRIDFVSSTTAAGSQLLRGIAITGNHGGVVEGNELVGFTPLPAGSDSVAIDIAASNGLRIEGNLLFEARTGIRCTASTGVAVRNSLKIHVTPLVGCSDGGGNLYEPF